MSEEFHQPMPSGAYSPDLDWSQVRETVRMLHLAVAQIEMAMREGDDSINTLTHSFTAMVENVQTISAAVSGMHGTEADDGTLESIQEHCNAITSGMHTSIVAFQFYDKLSQRLHHVADSLSALSTLVSDGQRLYVPAEWYSLQQYILSKYSMREEAEMFSALLRGASIEEALRLGQGELGKPSGDEQDDIELF